MSKPFKHQVTRLPKIVTCTRDFAEIDKFMRAIETNAVLEAKQIDDNTGEESWRIVQTTLERETYCVLAALDGWCMCFAEIAKAMQANEFDDAPLRKMMSKLRLEQPFSQQLLQQAKTVVNAQRRLYMLAPHGIINRVANSLLEKAVA